MKIVLIVLVLIFQLTPSMSSEWVSRNAEIMGTTIHTEVWHENKQLAVDAAELVLETMHEVNQRMSPYIDDSELSLVNQRAGDGIMTISPELHYVIASSLKYSELTEGAFDITFASVGYLYNYRKAQRPSQAEINLHFEGINYRHIDLGGSVNKKTIYFKHEQVRIDLGGIAKGYAVDLAIERVKQLGIEHILVTAGGDSRILGDRQGRPWVIGIRHPVDKSKVIAKIPLVDEALSTSGDYERYFDEDGVRYHHIIDPKTGDSARDVRSVTVLGPSAMDTDALSTSVFVLGAERGLALLESLAGIEGIIVDKNANLLFSSGLQHAK